MKLDFLLGNWKQLFEAVSPPSSPLRLHPVYFYFYLLTISSFDSVSLDLQLQQQVLIQSPLQSLWRHPCY